jgi:hypothetical protein
MIVVEILFKKNHMQNLVSFAALAVVLFIAIPAQAQIPETLSDRYIRVAEMGELVDSVNVWGDVNSSGRYLVPEGTNLPDLISFSFGYGQVRGGGGQSNVDWTKTQIEIKVSRFDENRKVVEVAYFRYLYHDPEPVEMWEFDLQNNDIVTVRVRNKPSLTDYLGVIAPVLSVITTSIFLLDRLRE